MENNENFKRKFKKLLLYELLSQAALRAIVSVWCNSGIVRECKESLRTFAPDRIRLSWVPGHSKILGNETPDALARLGAFSEGDLKVSLDPPICHLYGLINGWVRGEEQRRWGNVYGLL